MRARNLKPSLFKNELLATSDPLYTWIFQGLWCLADRAGRLEDRPRRIHLEINAGRAYEGTEAALVWLAENGFIQRYECADAKYIQVLKFEKHQNPHHREPESSIPAPGEPRESPGPAPGEPCSFPLPDSPFLIPESPFLGIEGESAPKRAPTAKRLPDDFQLTPERQATARAEAVNPEREFARFCDHWRAASGSNARKHDWDAAWRNWCRRAADMPKPKAQRTASVVDRLTWRPTEGE